MMVGCLDGAHRGKSLLMARCQSLPVAIVKGKGTLGY